MFKEGREDHEQQRLEVQRVAVAELREPDVAVRDVGNKREPDADRRSRHARITQSRTRQPDEDGVVRKSDRSHHEGWSQGGWSTKFQLRKKSAYSSRGM